jgi:hypothetical protein
MDFLGAQSLGAANIVSGLGHAQDALRHQGLSGGINIRLNHPE